MSLKVSIARIVLQSMSPYSQSRNLDDIPAKKGEAPDAYDKRVWMERLHCDGGNRVLIPESALLQAVVAGAKYSKKQIKGQGKATWTAKFQSGLMLPNGDVPTDQTREDVTHYDCYANADGVRGSGRRVWRRYPMLTGWTAEAEFYVLDPIIVEDVFTEILALTGLFIGIGRWRPEKGGQNGRFKIRSVEWEDNREFDELRR